MTLQCHHFLLYGCKGGSCAPVSSDHISNKVIGLVFGHDICNKDLFCQCPAFKPMEQDRYNKSSVQPHLGWKAAAAESYSYLG